MELIADTLLICGAAAAAFYCIVLSRRLSRFTDLEKGVGGAIAVLSAQVDDMTKTLQHAQGTASGSTDTLAALTNRAEDVARRLELLVASMHDLPTGEDDRANARPSAPEPSPAEDAAPKTDLPKEQETARPAESASLFRSARRGPGEQAA